MGGLEDFGWCEVRVRQEREGSLGLGEKFLSECADFVELV